jgi:DNA topoisomerase-1
MAEARLTFQTATITSGEAEFRATGRHVDFPGFFRAYVEGVDDPEAALDDQEAALPPLSEGTNLGCDKLDAISHETKPPARFTEATLVRELEADGIGRPSTYASIISTIQDRGYVRKVGNQLVPTFTALAVTRLLEDYFPKLVDYGFTAKMEQTLDDIATGEAERLPYLNEFYRGADGLVDQVKAKEESIDPRTACTLQLDGLEPPIRVGRYGPYFELQSNGDKVTVSIPESVAPADITNADVERMMREKKEGPTSLGVDPETTEPIFVRNGPFGPYIQRGEMRDDGTKPKRVSIPKNIEPSSVTLETAQTLLHLPKKLGDHPETHKSVKAGIGRFGPYVVHDGIYKSFNKDGTYEHGGQKFDVLNVDLPTALEMLSTARRRAPVTPLRELGPHPADGKPVVIMEGRYGAYVKHGKVNATIPKDRTVELVTFDEALGWLAKKAGGKAPRGGRAAKAPAAQAARKIPAAEEKAAARTPVRKKAAAPKTKRKGAKKPGAKKKRGAKK